MKGSTVGLNLHYLQSMEERDGNKIRIERLKEEMTEAEIRMTISTQNLPRPEKIVLEEQVGQVTAILHFIHEMEAFEFESQTEGRFLSSERNVKLSVRHIKTSPVYEAPDLSEDTSWSVKESPEYEAPYDPGEDIERNILSDVSDSPEYEAPYDPGEDIESIIKSEKRKELREEAELSFSPNSIQTNLSFLKKSQSVPSENINQVKTEFSPSSPSTSQQVKVEPNSGPEPTEVVLVNLYIDEEMKINQIKVYLVNVRKQQNFYGRESAILVGAVLRYIKKYHQAPASEVKMVLVTPCVASYGAFYQTVCDNQENKKIFHNYFTHWLDLQSLNNNYNVKDQTLNMIKGVRFSSNKVQSC